jgi:hypothetical protein
MGIRFHCPNGHKIHVKSFLAGKRGVCPRCGERFIIPSADADQSDDGGGDDIGLDPLPDADNGMPAGREKSPRRKPAGAAGNETLPGDPGSIDLESLAAAGGTSLLGGQAFGPAGQRLNSRRRSSQTMRNVTLGLTIAVTLLACVLLFILLRGK